MSLDKAHRAVAALAVATVVVSAVTIGIRASYGLFSDDFEVSATFPRAGQALKAGSDVKYRGVNVGRVRRITLVERRVRVVMGIHPSARVPRSVAARVVPKTLFGEKYVDLGVPAGAKAGPPWLRRGDRISRATAGDEVEDLISSSTGLFSGIDAEELATFMTELTQGVRGEGRNIARGFDAGVRASALFADTIDAQLRALDSFARFQREIRDIGPDLNGLSRNLVDFLPTFNAARADYERLLATLRPFADDLADWLNTVRPDLVRLLERGENVTRVLVNRREEIAQTVYGLSVYVQRFADAPGPDTLPDGSKMAYFKNFLLFGDIARAICAVVAPPGGTGNPGSDKVLGEIQGAMAARNPLLDCAKYGGGPTSKPSAPTRSSTGQPAPLAPVPAPLRDASARVDSAAATPDRRRPVSAPEAVLGGLLALGRAR
ncbi:MAG: MCE family protein [Actinobacteria bacterium]|nr:MCE family protein [Actinomycetota bacterium]